MSETATVYCLVDASGAPVYVGQTQLDISERTYNHWVCRTSSSLNRHNPMLASWLRTLPAAPKHEVLDVVRQSERLAVERYYITCFLWAGVPLLNRQQVPELLRVPVVSTDPVSRPSRSSIGWRGVVMPVSDWLRVLGIRSSTFYSRLSRGWTLRDALSRGADLRLLEAVGPDRGDPIMTDGSVLSSHGSSVPHDARHPGRASVEADQSAG